MRTARSSDSGRAPDRGGGHDAALVALSRLELRVAGSAALRWPDATFDKAFLVHTLYFRSEPEKDLRELRRVLKPAGSGGSPDFDVLSMLSMEVGESVED